MSQFFIPLPSKMDMTGDLVYNWEFFRDSWKNYATATKLANKDTCTMPAISKNAFKNILIGPVYKLSGILRNGPLGTRHKK